MKLTVTVRPWSNVKYNEGKYKLTNYINWVHKIQSMVNYDKVCNNVFKDNIRRVQKIFMNDWRELDSLISFPREL